MEKKRKKFGVENSMILAEKSSQEITFDAFFTECVRVGKLQSWQRLEIAAFFRDDMRLREKEDLRIFEEALAKY